jgi:hypothetical protein
MIGINWRDVGQAINDLQLQIVVILATLFILIFLSIIFGKISVRLNHDSECKSRPQVSAKSKSPVGLRLRARRGIRQTSFQTKQDSDWWANFWQGISTEFFGAVVITLILGLSVMICDQYQYIQNRKADLVLQMGSPDHATAIEAVRQLRAERWTRDGTLRGAILTEANLQGLYLPWANLQEADLWHANLQDANLEDANLRQANLPDANLQSTFIPGVNLQLANLTGTNLQEAVLSYADLRGAALYYADLQGARLDRANLEGARIENVNLQGAILPDGSEWTADTDMMRFVDANHPNYWNPCVELEMPHLLRHCGD